MKQSQADKLYELLKSGRPVRTDEILRVVYGSSHSGIARIGARIHDIKGKLPQGWTIRSWKDPERPSLWFYQLAKAGPMQLFSGYPTPSTIEEKE